MCMWKRFLSTLSLRRATTSPRSRPRQLYNFYPRSPCGERRTQSQIDARVIPISIHALLAESDAILDNIQQSNIIFLSTLSLRRATSEAVPRRPDADISIHALLAESDSRSQRSKSWQYYFYPRSPCGERLRWKLPCTPWHIFLSTLSLRRATGGYKALGFDTLISIHALLAESDFNGDHGHMSGDISIHALLAESDVPGYGAPFVCTHFYPRSPCGERQAEQTAREQADKFLSTLSLRRATVLASILCTSIKYFYPRSPCGERPQS